MREGPVGEKAELLGLVGTGLDEIGAAVAHVDAEQRRQTVEIAVAVLVLDVATFAAHDDRDLVILVGRHAGEVHPQMATPELLERARLRPYRFLGACHAKSPSSAVLYNGNGEHRPNTIVRLRRITR